MGSIDDLGLKIQQLAINLRAEGLTYQSIANRLSSECNKEVSVDEVRNFLAKNEKNAIKVLKSSDKMQTKLAETYFNTLTQLNDLNREMWSFWYDLRKNPEFQEKSFSCKKCGSSNMVRVQQYSNMLKAADHLLNQIRHVDAVLGKLQKKGINITYNYVDLSKKIQAIVPKILQNTNPNVIKKIMKTSKKKMEYKEEQDYEDDLEDDEDLELEEL